MGDHLRMEGDTKGWKAHDDHLRAIIKLTGEVLKRYKAIDKNGRKIAGCSARIAESLTLKPSTYRTEEFFADNTRIVIRAPHNPEMTRAATKGHHKNLEDIVRILEDQVEQSALLNKAFEGLREHHQALVDMFQK
jgi:hypothetical protein